jgi:hypothetical protein
MGLSAALLLISRRPSSTTRVRGVHRDVAMPVAADRGERRVEEHLQLST